MPMWQWRRPVWHLPTSDRGTAIEAPEAERLSVAINGEGVLSHEAVRVDERRLVIDIPCVLGPSPPTVHVGHRLSNRFVSATAEGSAGFVGDGDYVVEPRGAQLLVTVKDAPAGDSTLDSQVAAMAEAILPRLESRGCRGRQGTGGRPQSGAGLSRPSHSMMTEPEAVESILEKRISCRRNPL
jgi:hypothetical protein